MSNKLIIPSVPSLGALTINDANATGFGYNPSAGPSSNAINKESSAIFMSKKALLTPTSSNSIFDRNVTTKKSSGISISSLAFFFCEIVSWAHRLSCSILDLENRLNGLGYLIGQKYLELVKLREGMKYGKRENKILEILQFIHGPFWRVIFGRTANDLEKSQNVDDEYMISDNSPLLSRFISIPKDYGNLNCSAFVAGMIEGALDLSGFHATVVAHSSPVKGFPQRTTYLIKFDALFFTREGIQFN